ncbi:MAG: hypothetical protein DHS20C18_27770 [Saprospiraceae bacterium]|nr:MAG: hypothetical protein DHS20C18_27770 [Saprospiraceae bacterium]
MKYLLPLVLILLTFSCQNTPPANVDWAWYLGGPDANHYSPLQQINKENVAQLQVAWTYQSGDKDDNNRSQIQCNPLVIDGILYGTSPKLKLFALDAATGEELWQFDPFDEAYQQFGMGVNRGLVYWNEAVESARIFFTAGTFLYAIDAATGQVIPTFGQQGKVDLHQGLGEAAQDYFIVSNTPGIVYKDLLILGMRVSEDIGAAPGYIRAFDVRTGEIRWIFHTIPQPGEMGYETWPPDAWKTSGGANAWSGLSLDEERGIVFIPTGSASYDFYGGDRIGQNLFANCVLALNAETGERIWHFQTVHHDLWDRDLPASPNLVQVKHEGKTIDAVAQITKSGHIFLLDRTTGEPLFPVEEIPVPESHLKGEQTWPTQPLPVKPPPFSRQEINKEDLTSRGLEAQAYAQALWEKSRKGSLFVPPGEDGSFIFPGLDGGGEWGGAAVDPEGILYINSSEIPWYVQMEKFTPADDNLLASRGERIYRTSCRACHGQDREGGDMFGSIPALTGLKDRLPEAEAINIIKNGKGVMPSFSLLKDEEIKSIIAFLYDSKEEIDANKPPTESTWPYPYVFGGYNRFYAPDGYPAIQPPWGQLTAVDLNEGTIKWQIPFGEYPELKAQGTPITGTESYGGPIVTESGLIFIAATLDEKIRAYDKENGALLWEATLPAAGYATPATYSVDGRQYVVIAAGGGKLNTPSGDAYVAFALPE